MRISDMVTQLALNGAEFVPVYDPNQLDLSEQNRKMPVEMLRGYQGERGFRGLSAYEVWLNNGFTGTIDDFLNSLMGQDGADGADGTNGKSAYQSWIDVGNSGSEEDFVNDLKGDSAYKTWLSLGNTGSTSAFIESLKGPQGFSAYELWLTAGNSGSSDDFLEDLIGDSAYDIWRSQGNDGSESDFIYSLKGQDGAQGPSGAPGTPGPTGATGATGTTGSRWYEGHGAPSSGLGANSDFYLDIDTGDVYGPKTAGTWGGVDGNIQGPAGIDGDAQVGPTGATGDSAYEIWLDAGHTGTEADFLNSIKGATGATGATGNTGPAGATGPGVITGGSSGQVLTKNSTTNYDASWKTPSGIVMLAPTVPLCFGNGITGLTHVPAGPATLINVSAYVPAGARYIIVYGYIGTGGSRAFMLAHPTTKYTYGYDHVSTHVDNINNNEYRITEAGVGTSNDDRSGTQAFIPINPTNRTFYVRIIGNDTEDNGLWLMGYVT